MTDQTDQPQTPTAVAVQQHLEGPAGAKRMIAAYADHFAEVLPSHVQRPETWVRIAQGALKKGKVNANGLTDLEVAALNNPGVFLSFLLDAARLGLEPGTEQYYLTPRRIGKGPNARLEILGIIGYQGHIELMYRAGAISSVIAEVVYAGDGFEYQPGRDDVPLHTIDWDAEDRGALRLVYAYAKMKDGATSRVVVLNRQAIDKIKKSSPSADSDYSPWKQHEPAMWLKSAVRQLQKWVPTSAEYVRTALDATAAVDAAAGVVRPVIDGALGSDAALPSGVPGPDDLPDVDSNDGWVPDSDDPSAGDDEITDAEIVHDDDADEVPESVRLAEAEAERLEAEDLARRTAEAAAVQTGTAPPVGVDPETGAVAPDSPYALADVDKMTEPQSRALHALLRKADKTAVGPGRFPVLTKMLGREITSTDQISKAEASSLIDALQPTGAGDDEAGA